MIKFNKEKYMDPVDAAVAAWGKNYPERYNTIEYNTDNEYFNIYVGEYFFSEYNKLSGNWAADYRKVREYLEETLVSELKRYYAKEMYVEDTEGWVNAMEEAENLLTLSDAWDLGLTVEHFLRRWARNNLWQILYHHSRRILSVEIDGKSAKYDYPADNFRRDVRHFIDKNVEKNLKNPDRYASIIANYLYDAWNEDFSIFFDHYDEHEGVIYDDEYWNNIATA